jgi:hypothetical protein
MADKITWADKESLVTDPTILEKNKVTDSNMNEIKSVVNDNADNLDELIVEGEENITENTRAVIKQGVIRHFTEISNTYGTSESIGYSQKYQNAHNVIVSADTPTTDERVWFYKSANLNKGINQEVWINQAATQTGGGTGNSGIYIPVNGGKYTVSSAITQTRYRIGCTTNEPSTTLQTIYNGTNQDGSSNSVTINTSGYNYLVVDATDITKIQIQEGEVATPFKPYERSINVDGEEIYSTNYNNYSSSEIVVGQFLGKPLYRKVIKLTTTQNNDTKTYDLTSLSISEIKHIYGATHFPGYTRNLYDTYAANGTVMEFTGAYISGNTLTFKSYHNNPGATFYGDVEIVIEYTKTTD